MRTGATTARPVTARIAVSILSSTIETLVFPVMTLLRFVFRCFSHGARHYADNVRDSTSDIPRRTSSASRSHSCTSGIRSAAMTVSTPFVTAHISLVSFIPIQTRLPILSHDLYDSAMSELQERMPYVAAFPEALGTGIIVRSAQPISPVLQRDLQSLIDEYDATLSRFRTDSLVGLMAAATCGGSFDFPDWTLPLFDLYDALDAASRGAIDPCVGEDLIRLGYGADMTFTIEPDAHEHTGSIHGRPTWRSDVERHGTTLVTRRAVHLDFGACGKGYLVDLLARRLRQSVGSDLLIDAGGDMTVSVADAAQPVTIGLEDPADASNAVGIAHMADGSLCASAPSRRHWGAAHRLHHLLNAIDGLPAHRVAASWVAVPRSTTTLPDRSGAPAGTATGTVADATFATFPTAIADGLATALFVTEPDRLAEYVAFSCALLAPDRRVILSRGFPGRFFTA